MQEIDAVELERLRAGEGLRAGERPPVVLDVRERGEFALGQIAGATPLARGLIELRLPRVVPDAGWPLVLYCDDGRRSALAADTVAALGYADVRVLAGGLDAWRASGRPVIEGWGVSGKAHGERVALAGVPQVTAEELAARRARGEPVTVVDVRTAEEYLRGHVPEAYHVPGGQLVREVPALLERPDAPVIVSCAGRTRGILGAALLREAGLENVQALLNGAMGWRLAGYALEEGPGRGRPSVAPETHAEWTAEATTRLIRDEGIRFIAAPECAAPRAAQPHYLVDVRLPEEYRAGHVRGAISLPAGQLALHYENWLAIPTLPVIVVADDPVRPVWAAALLQRLGFADVRVLEGGIPAWAALGQPLEEGDDQPEVMGLAAAQHAGHAITAPDLAMGRRAREAAVLDVRGSGEFGMGHLPGARWLARGKLELGIAAMAPDQTTPVVTVCDTGVRAALAAATLRALGYRSARYLEGGVPAWQADGLPIEEGLEGAEVSVAEAQGDFGHTLWSGAMQRTRADMENYLSWEENLPHTGASSR
jgi:rhodanese-related sulfurtransferase